MVWNTDGEVEALVFWKEEDQEGEGEVRFWCSESICESNAWRIAFGEAEMLL